MNRRTSSENLRITELEEANDDTSNVASQVENDRKENRLQSYVLVGQANLRKQPQATVELIQYLNAAMANYNYKTNGNKQGRKKGYKGKPNNRKRRDKDKQRKNKRNPRGRNRHNNQGEKRDDNSKDNTKRKQEGTKEHKQYSRKTLMEIDRRTRGEQHDWLGQMVGNINRELYGLFPYDRSSHWKARERVSEEVNFHEDIIEAGEEEIQRETESPEER